MAMEVVTTNPNPDSRLNNPSKSNGKRKPKRVSNGAKLAKRMKSMPKYQGSRKKPTDNKKERRLIRKRDREYNSDEEEVDREGSDDEEKEESEGSSDEDKSAESSGDEDGDEAKKQEITKFTEGCRAFKMSFMKIMKKNQSSDPLGPVLSAHRKLVVDKLAEEVDELKAKGEAKKKKLLIEEKGHVLPANFLDSKEKFLISMATKGVVRLFNEAYKSQHSKNGFNPTKSKGAKAYARLTRKSSSQTNGGLFNSSKTNQKQEEEENEEPAWAPLKDSYMLTNPKLKDWDKMPVSSSVGDSRKTPLESSSDED